MRALKLLAFVLGGLAVLIGLVLVGVWLFVNPNDYKDRIAQQVKTTTGRELVLDGPIKLSVFPWIALELGHATLGNPPGFGTEPFVSVQHVALRVKLMPLLRKELQIGKVEIDGMDLRLKKNADGKGNWEGFGKDSSAPAPQKKDQGPATLPDLAGVAIHASRISYDTLTLANFNFDMGTLASRTPVPISAKFDVDRGADAGKLNVVAALNATLDVAAKHYGLDAVTLSGDLATKSDPRAIAWRVSIPSVDLDLAAQTLKTPAFTAQFASAQLSGSVSGATIVDAPRFSGMFKLEPLVLREFMGRMGMEAPKTKDARALTQFSASAGFTYGGNALAIDQLVAVLDESKLSGSVAVTNLDTKALKFDLNLDRINVDHYLSPEKAEAKPDAKPADLPSAQIKSFIANGSIAIGQAIVTGVELTNIKMTVDSKDGVVHLYPTKAQLYGGQYSGDITYDAHGSVPALRLDQQMTGIDIAQLLKATVKSDRLSGRGNASTKLTGQGQNSDAVIKSLNGRVDANLANGAVEGIDLWYEISRAEALIKRQDLPAGSSAKRTAFDTFKASADIAGGVATVKDLNIASKQLKVTGQGTANFISRAIDYKIVATISKAPPGGTTPGAKGADLSHLALAAIPVNITGTMSDPKVRPDLEGIAKAQLQQKVDEKKDELKKKLQDKLQGLFH